MSAASHTTHRGGAKYDAAAYCVRPHRGQLTIGWDVSVVVMAPACPRGSPVAPVEIPGRFPACDPPCTETRPAASDPGETARKRTPETSDDLTPQEAQIAHLAADGLWDLGSRLSRWLLHKPPARPLDRF
jgi:hypothetical protein